MPKPPPADRADEPVHDARLRNAGHWRRFRRLMLAMFALSLVVVALAVLWLVGQGVPLQLHIVVAMGLGIALSLMLAAGLMGLVYVSARTGVDDAVRDLPPPDRGEAR